MGYEESFITMKLIQHGYLVPSLCICIHETPTETGLTVIIKNMMCMNFSVFHSPFYSSYGDMTTKKIALTTNFGKLTE